jgi:hypothetical protein
MKKIIILTALLTCLSAFSQESIKDYKYVVVPLEYDFTNGKDKYRLNTQTRYLFKERGFEVYFDEQDLPEELSENPCLAIYADVKKVKGGFLNTKLQMILSNCYGEEILRSEEGVSRQKPYDLAYSEALHQAFKTFGDFNVKLESKSQSEKENLSKIAEVNETDNNIPSVALVKKESEQKQDSEVFYAQPTQEGFQLVNTVPEVVMVLLKTSTENVFKVKGKTATVFIKDGKWIYSEKDGKTTIEKELNIKF